MHILSILGTIFIKGIAFEIIDAVILLRGVVHCSGVVNK
jgi:hypothetical protein